MKNITPISKEDLGFYRARFVRVLWRDMLLAFKKREKEGWTRQDIAARLGVHKSVISRRLNGSANITIGILSDMVRALDYKPEVKLRSYESFVKSQNINNQISFIKIPSHNNSHNSICLTQPINETKIYTTVLGGNRI